MKTRLLLMMAATLAIAGFQSLPSAYAQASADKQDAATNNAAPALPAVDQGGSKGAQLWQLAKDAAGFFRDNTNLFNNGSAIVEGGALYNQGKYGGFVDVQFPVDAQLSLGFAGAYLDGQLYDAALSARLGTTWQVPVIGPVYSFIETGPGYNLSKREVIAQSFAGALWKHQFNDKWALQIGGAVGNISDRPGAVIAGSLGLTYKFK